MITKCTLYDEIETTSFDGVEDGYEEVTVIADNKSEY